jgi:hypothetical protein
MVLANLKYDKLAVSSDKYTIASPKGELKLLIAGFTT